MAAPTSLPLGDLAGDFYSRRLLLLSLNSHRLSFLSTSASPPAPVVTNVSTSPNPDAYGPGDNSFDSNVVMVLSVLLCALICSLGLNSIIRCALRCSSFVASDPSSGSTPTRLANTGVKRKALKTFPIVSYSSEQNNLPRLDTECVICLSEFTAGDRVRLLPKCHHGFHVKCIDRWLSSHSSCPTCRHCLIETCQKIIGCTSTSTSTSQSQPQQIQITIASLEPEGFMRNYRGANQL